MDDLINAVATLFKVGLFGAAALIVAVYVAYMLESHCVNPMGCVNDSPEAKQMEESADLVAKWARQ